MQPPEPKNNLQKAHLQKPSILLFAEQIIRNLSFFLYHFPVTIPSDHFNNKLLTERGAIYTYFFQFQLCGARFSKAQETFRACKAIAKSRTLRLQGSLIHIFLIWREVPFIQEVSDVYNSLFLI